jgi:CheY-like chemotaxis protein
VKLSILCVDDEIPGLFLRKMVLEAHGYRVVTASSGKEALAFAKSMQFDAVILDFNMPEMNGGEIAERLRGQLPHLKIIMLSGYPEDVSPEIQGLMDAFVCKGGSPNELCRPSEPRWTGKFKMALRATRMCSLRIIP